MPRTFNRQPKSPRPPLKVQPDGRMDQTDLNIFVKQIMEMIWQLEGVSQYVVDILDGASTGIDHGKLIGLADDDHTQYILTDGTRSLTGDWDNITFRIRNTGVSEVTTTPPTTPAKGLVWLDTGATGTGGTGVLNIVTITASTTLTTSHTVVLCDATTGNITTTLPSSSGNSGRFYYIKKIDSSTNTVTVDGNANETIDGDPTAVLEAQYESITPICDGSNWHIS